MNQSNRSSAIRRLVGLLLFVSGACTYAVVAIGVLLKSEHVRTIDANVDWTVAEKLVAFPAFYLGVDPLTGLIVNATAWGLVGALFVWLWPRHKH